MSDPIVTFDEAAVRGELKDSSARRSRTPRTRFSRRRPTTS